MDRRSEIAVIYSYSKNWIGGTYYVQNLVKALNSLEDGCKPVVNVYTQDKKTFDTFKSITEYPYLNYRYFSTNISIFKKTINKFLRIVKLDSFQFGVIRLSETNDDLIFPVSNYEIVFPKSKIIGWIPDFQEKYYPQFFSKEELASRERIHRGFVSNNIPIVFSSRDALKDFNTYYSDISSKTQTFVLPFAVSHPDFSNISIDTLLDKYNITKKFLFCANQFWIHKNHKFLFQSFAKAKEKGLDLQLVCSGNMFDYRNAAYGRELNELLKTLDIINDVKLVGFIDREEQLCLMKHSYAMIQPSLFEGWSTVVEDAKALNKFIFLSDLAVHKEQSPKNVCFFDPANSDDLVDKLLSVKVEEDDFNYNANINEFARNFVSIMDAFKKRK